MFHFGALAGIEVSGGKSSTGRVCFSPNLVLVYQAVYKVASVLAIRGVPLLPTTKYLQVMPTLSALAHGKHAWPRATRKVPSQIDNMPASAKAGREELQPRESRQG